MSPETKGTDAETQEQQEMRQTFRQKSLSVSSFAARCLRVSGDGASNRPDQRFTMFHGARDSDLSLLHPGNQSQSETRGEKRKERETRSFHQLERRESFLPLSL